MFSTTFLKVFQDFFFNFLIWVNNCSHKKIYSEKKINNENNSWKIRTLELFSFELKVNHRILIIHEILRLRIKTSLIFN